MSTAPKIQVKVKRLSISNLQPIYWNNLLLFQKKELSHQIDTSFKLSILKFNKKNKIQERVVSLITFGRFNDSYAAVKSYDWTQTLKATELFINEVITLQLIFKTENELLDGERTRKSNSFAKYLGFALNDLNKDYPYYGSIIIKYYPIGDLSAYTLNTKNREWLAQNPGWLDGTESYAPTNSIPLKDKEITEFIDLALQISEGLILFYLQRGKYF